MTLKIQINLPKKARIMDVRAYIIERVLACAACTRMHNWMRCIFHRSALLHASVENKMFSFISTRKQHTSDAKVTEPHI